MLASGLGWLLAAAFLGAGSANLVAPQPVRANFARWGYPGWMCRATGAVEVLAAVLIAAPATRAAALVLGAAIILAAAATVLRHRDWGHLVPLAGFAILLGIVAGGR